MLWWVGQVYLFFVYLFDKRSSPFCIQFDLSILILNLKIESSQLIGTINLIVKDFALKGNTRLTHEKENDV